MGVTGFCMGGALALAAAALLPEEISAAAPYSTAFPVLTSVMWARSKHQCKLTLVVKIH